MTQRVIASLSLLAVVVAACCVAVTPAAMAQDPALTEKLVQLTRKKGFKNFPVGVRACTNLGLRDDGKDCRAYQAPYTELGHQRTVNVFEEPDNRVTYMILGNVNNRSGEVATYLVGLDGKLIAAGLREAGTKRWSKLSLESKATQKGFADEVAYWRAKLPELEKEPNRKD